MLANGHIATWDNFLSRPQVHGHAMQLCRLQEGAIERNVQRYVAEGLKQGDGVLMFVPNWQREALRQDFPDAVASRQLVTLDAQETLARIAKDGLPDWDLFSKQVRGAFRRVRRGHPGGGLRAYGETMGILWKTHQFGAAVVLEQFWNKLLEQLPFSLYCSYAMDIFSEEFETANVQGALGLHSDLVPCEPDGSLDLAIQTAMEEMLGPRAEAARSQIRASHPPAWPAMPGAEASVLWLRANLRSKARAIITRARTLYRSGQKTRAVSPLSG
jgi:hypothetical protein